MQQIAIGAVVGVFGINGELRVKPLADEDVFRRLKECSLSSATIAEETKTVVAKRFHKGNWLIKFSGIDTPEDGMLLKGARISVPMERLPEVASDEVYWFQIEGADVIDEEGIRVGVLADYMETGSHDVFQIAGDDGVEYLISNNPNHVLHIDPAGKAVKVMRIGLVAAN